VIEEANLGAACTRMVNLANERGGEDNITVIVARVMGDDIPLPRATETVTETYESLEEFDLKKIYD
jgi:PPM family protein phosphatase